jgi:hypothetical protein
MGGLKLKSVAVNQQDFTICKLTADVQHAIINGRYLYGIDKNRVAHLIQSDFKNVLNYELILIAKFLNMYLFEFEEKYNITFKNV